MSKPINPEWSTFSAYSVCGIYFLIQNGLCVYVGKSLNCHFRVMCHFNDEEKIFSEYAIIEAEPEELDRLEAKFVLEYDPEYNKEFPRNGEFIPWETLANKCAMGRRELRRLLTEKQINPVAFLPRWTLYRKSDVLELLQIADSTNLIP